MKKDLKETLKLCFIIIIILFLICGVISIIFFNMSKKYDDYIMVDGIIIDSWKDSYYEYDSYYKSGRTKINYYTKYRYKINETYYENTTKGANFSNLSTVNVLVNPKNYQDSIIEKDSRSYTEAIPILFISATIISIMMLIINLINIHTQRSKQ